MAHEDLILIAKDYVHHLVLGDYHYSKGLGVLDDIPLLSPDYVAQSIADYEATLTDPPEAAFVLPPAYAPGVNYRGVAVDLWTLEEGESNLQLDLDITLTAPHHIVNGALTGCPPKIIPALQEVIHHLVVGDYAGLEDHGRLQRYGLAGEDVEEAIVDYRTRAWEYSEPRSGTALDWVLVDMPEHAFRSAYVVHSTPGAWTADIQLWWNCIQGDLTLRTEIEVKDDGISVQILGLEVM